MNFVFPVIIFCFTISLSSAQEPTYKVCALNEVRQDCDQLGRQRDVQCNYNAHGVDCLLNIEKASTDFGRVTAEEALVAASFTNDVVVVGEYRLDALKDDDSTYATTVVVRSNTVTGFSSLKGKKYCHPGFKYDSAVSDLLLKEFEATVLKANNVDECSTKVETGTAAEKQIKALNDYFGPSCRPGPWIDLEDVDSKFYKQYSKLCKLCPQSGNCTITAGTNPVMQSLECLVSTGDVAVTTLNTVYEYFNRTENFQKESDYRYLCRDGTLRSLNNPCTWARQPWDLIVANKNQASSLAINLNEWLSKYTLEPTDTPSTNSKLWETSLLQVLSISENNKIKIFTEHKPLKEYIAEYRTIPSVNGSERCQNNIKWCTISPEENKKCEWLAQASLNQAIQPVLKCYSSSNKFSCLEDISTGKADVVTSDAHYGYIARKKNLAPLAYPETYASYDLINTIVVVKEDNKLNIKKFADLKNKTACMPEYGGIEWLSFINTALEHDALSKSTCDYGQLISDFVGDSCIPGSLDKEHETSVNIDTNKLCSLCQPVPNNPTATTCNADASNRFYGNRGALDCLVESGEFAVITKKEFENVNPLQFRVLCRNGTMASYPGFNVDDNCVLATIVDSEVVSKKNSAKNGDIENVLLNFEKRFGQARVKPFHVFNTFNDTNDLLFKTSTKGLAAKTSSNVYIKNYLKLFSHVDECVARNEPGSATTNMINNVILVFIVLLIWK